MTFGIEELPTTTTKQGFTILFTDRKLDIDVSVENVDDGCRLISRFVLKQRKVEILSLFIQMMTLYIWLVCGVLLRRGLVFVHISDYFIIENTSVSVDKNLFFFFFFCFLVEIGILTIMFKHVVECVNRWNFAYVILYFARLF